MSNRQTLRLPFGGGLDRKSGSAVVDPKSFGNLQNVHLFRGRMELRKGLERALALGWGEDIIAIEPIRSRSVTAVVVWDTVSREVRLYLVDGSLSGSAFVGTLWTLPSTISGRPEVTCAELYNKLVIAHNEATFALRQITKVYDAAAGTISSLAVDLDRSGGAENIKFRGVCRHLNYLCGWGYGTGADEDRPEVFRISKPGIPGAISGWFVPEHYFLVGTQGDPILGAGKSGNMLEICKVAEAYGLTGYSRDNFGIIPLDMNHGQLAGRLGVTVGGERFRWGLNGPRVSTGGESIDLEMPLDLAGPDADPLVSAVESDNAFAVFDPKENEVLFVFDYWAYVLHLKDGERRWSYRPYAWEIGAAGIIYVGSTTLLDLADPTVGATYANPSFAGGSVDDYQPTFNVTWSLLGTLIGGEQAEVWVRSLYAGATTDPFGLGYTLAEGEWKLRTTVAATALAATIKGMHFHTNHEIAVRLTLSGTPGVGYFGNPDTWPSKITVLAGGAIASWPFTSAGFRRDSATALRRLLTYTGPGNHPNGGSFPLQPQLTVVFEKSGDAGANWGDCTGGNNKNTGEAAHTHAERHIAWRYRLKIVGPHGDSGFSTTSDLWLGPTRPANTVNTAADNASVPGGHYHVVTGDWPAEEAGLTAEARLVHAPAGTTDTNTGSIVAGTATIGVTTAVAPAPPQTATGGLRGVLTSFGETDVSEWRDDPSPVNEP